MLMVMIAHFGRFARLASQLQHLLSVISADIRLAYVKESETLITAFSLTYAQKPALYPTNRLCKRSEQNNKRFY